MPPPSQNLAAKAPSFQAAAERREVLCEILLCEILLDAVKIRTPRGTDLVLKWMLTVLNEEPCQQAFVHSSKSYSAPEEAKFLGPTKSCKKLLDA